MTMFDGLTMVSYDGHNRNKMMVDHVWTMVDHGRPWSGGQMFAGVGLCSAISSCFVICSFKRFSSSFLRLLYSTNFFPCSILRGFFCLVTVSCCWVTGSVI